jgi:hypothetical protein
MSYKPKLKVDHPDAMDAVSSVLKIANHTS